MASIDLHHYSVYDWHNLYCNNFSKQKIKMDRFITKVLYIDIKTGEIFDKDGIKGRNFLETDRKIKTEYKNGMSFFLK